MSEKTSPAWLNLSPSAADDPKPAIHKSIAGVKKLMDRQRGKSNDDGPIFIDALTLQINKGSLCVGDLLVSSDGVWMLTEPRPTEFEWVLIDMNLQLLTDQIGSAVFTTLRTTPEA